jgi:hypothetical protein
MILWIAFGMVAVGVLLLAMCMAGAPPGTIDYIVNGQENPAVIWPHCQTPGHVRVKTEKVKGGISGAKASAAILTGGTSELRGIKHLAEEIFGMPVQLCRARNVVGVTSAFENPQFSTAIGLVKYAQATRDDERGGLFGWIKGLFT